MQDRPWDVHTPCCGNSLKCIMENPVMQHFSLNALFNDKEGGCDAYLWGCLCVCGGGGQFSAKLWLMFGPLEGRAFFRRDKSLSPALWDKQLGQVEQNGEQFNTSLTQLPACVLERLADASVGPGWFYLVRFDIRWLNFTITGEPLIGYRIHGSYQIMSTAKCDIHNQ